MAKVLMKGNEAIAEAAILAGCRFFFGYPITPQNQIPEYMSKRMPKVGGAGREADKVYISRDIDRALTRADEIAGEMKDEFLSVEHLFLGLIDAAAKLRKQAEPEESDPRIDKTAHNVINTGSYTVRIVNSHGMDRSYTEDVCALSGNSYFLHDMPFPRTARVPQCIADTVLYNITFCAVFQYPPTLFAARERIRAHSPAYAARISAFPRFRHTGDVRGGAFRRMGFSHRMHRAAKIRLPFEAAQSPQNLRFPIFRRIFRIKTTLYSDNIENGIRRSLWRKRDSRRAARTHPRRRTNGARRTSSLNI